MMIVVVVTVVMVVMVVMADRCRCDDKRKVGMVSIALQGRINVRDGRKKQKDGEMWRVFMHEVGGFPLIHFKRDVMK